MTEAKRDSWAEWLAERRFGGDVDVKREALGRLERIGAEVLDRAGLAGGETLLDVGSGEGLIGFGALQRGVGTVIFSDISEDLLGFCRNAAQALGTRERCRFVQASADDLSAVESESVDVVTTRSVLIYVKDKDRAFREFFRVLRPGGRISLFEPINSFAFPEPPTRFGGYELGSLQDIALRLRHVYEAIQPPDSDPMLDFDERDLIRLSEEAGFFPVNLLFRAEVGPVEPRPWETFIRVAGNPTIPTLAETMDEALSDDERSRLTNHLRPLVEAGQGVRRMGSAFLSATRPS